jgi:hypothetical protein
MIGRLLHSFELPYELHKPCRNKTMPRGLTSGIASAGHRHSGGLATLSSPISVRWSWLLRRTTRGHDGASRICLNKLSSLRRG